MVGSCTNGSWHDMSAVARGPARPAGRPARHLRPLPRLDAVRETLARQGAPGRPARRRRGRLRADLRSVPRLRPRAGRREPAACAPSTATSAAGAASRTTQVYLASPAGRGRLGAAPARSSTRARSARRPSVELPGALERDRADSSRRRTGETRSTVEGTELRRRADRAAVRRRARGRGHDQARRQGLDRRHLAGRRRGDHLPDQRAEAGRVHVPARPRVRRAREGGRRRASSSAARRTGRARRASTPRSRRCTSACGRCWSKTLARIHRANLINWGVLPLEFADPADYDADRAGRPAAHRRTCGAGARTDGHARRSTNDTDRTAHRGAHAC